MLRNMLKLVLTVGGCAALLYPDTDGVSAREADGSSRALQVAQEGSQRKSKRRGADRPADRNAPKMPAVKAQPPVAPSAPAETSGRDAALSTEPVKASTWTAQEVANMQIACLKTLAPIRASIDVSEPLRDGDCGTLGAVTVRSVGGVDPVTISPASPLTCPMVVPLHDWVEAGLQPIARALFGVPIATLTGVGTYQCRDRVGGTVGLRSEHAVANAIDITAFVLADGRAIDVKAHWGPTARDGSPPATAKPVAPLPTPKANGRDKERRRPKPNVSTEDAQVFLKAVHRAACRHFTTVLGPESNEAHRDHFHFDMAQRRSAYRLCE